MAATEDIQLRLRTGFIDDCTKLEASIVVCIPWVDKSDVGFEGRPVNRTAEAVVVTMVFPCTRLDMDDNAQTSARLWATRILEKMLTNVCSHTTNGD